MSNSFPESPAKKYLRRDHYTSLMLHSKTQRRELVYFGLPSSEMLDVRLWSSHIKRIFAIEREENIAQEMLRTAESLKIRNKLTVIDKDLNECARLLALDETNISHNLNRSNKHEQTIFAQLRSTLLDVINLDMFGGYVYSRNDNLNTNTEIIRDLFSHQQQFGEDFILILTYGVKDTGADEYDRFNKNFLKSLSDTHKVDTGELEKYYLQKDGSSQLLSMRRLRLALPMSILGIGRDNFEIESIKSWLYNSGSGTTLFSLRLHLKSRPEIGSLGEVWPPIDEVRRILAASVVKLDVDSAGNIQEIPLPAPAIPI